MPGFVGVFRSVYMCVCGDGEGWGGVLEITQSAHGILYHSGSYLFFQTPWLGPFETAESMLTSTSSVVQLCIPIVGITHLQWDFSSLTKSSTVAMTTV